MAVLPSRPSCHVTRRTLLRVLHYRWKFATALLRNARMPRLYCLYLNYYLLTPKVAVDRYQSCFVLTEIPGTQIGLFAALKILCRPSVRRRKTLSNT